MLIWMQITENEIVLEKRKRNEKNLKWIFASKRHDVLPTESIYYK